MHLYLITRKDYGIDEYCQKLVRAESEEDARRFASKHTGDERAAEWLTPEYSTCQIVSTEGEAGVLAECFRPG